MKKVRKIAHHEASLILHNSFVESERVALGLYNVCFYTGSVNGKRFELVTQVGAFSRPMAHWLAFRKIRRGWISRALDEYNADVTTRNSGER